MSVDLANKVQLEANEREETERKRIAGLSLKNLEGEIRRAKRTTGNTNHLCYILATGLLMLTGSGDLFRGNDPYCLKYSGTRSKTTRKRNKTVVLAKAA